MRSIRLLLLAAGLSWCATALAAKPWQPHASRPMASEANRIPLAPPPLERSADYRAALHRGLDLLGRGRYPEAAQALEKAAALCPDCAEARLARARALLTVGYLSWEAEAVRRALADARASMELDPGGREGRQLWQLANDLWRRMSRVAPRAQAEDKPPPRPAKAERR